MVVVLQTPTLTMNQIINGSAIVIIQPSCADNDGEIQATCNQWKWQIILLITKQ